MNISQRSSFFTMLQLVVARSVTTRAFAPISSIAGWKTGTHRIVARHMSTENEDKALDPNDPLAPYRNQNNIDDQVFSAMSKDGSVKVTACTARNLVNDLMIMHTMTAVPANALGRTISCALMMSNGMQEEQTVQITMNCKGMNLYDFVSDWNFLTESSYLTHRCVFAQYR
jgi:hypothetical protein